MNAIRIIQKPVYGKLIIEVPESFDNKDCEIIILKVIDEEVKNFVNESEPTRYEVLQKYKGILKDSTYQVNKDDVYNQ